ncbi:ATP-binding cassette domain-containing protein [Clostridium tarantellae]|uniref:ATP-binding cassette domain-containing protein n=1 Tax=Clostridium tarantellae TaxID=39493 RepID=A0A6I1MS01_9CLOT|nr:ABC transporter ATP-binding protein [Clostridium tarantellae]MPQ44977.1 ATP-binding cassette domain-containing protein [Clostridium tarantellae]
MTNTVFDNPQYYDKLAIIQRDSQAISNILWSTLSLISGIISIIISFGILCNTSMKYGILIIISVIPSIISNRIFAQKVFNLSISQIKNERKASYLLYLATQREYAQNVRLFNIGSSLNLRYTQIWNSMFLVKKKLLKKRFLMIALLQLLPEIIILYINLDVAFKVIDQIMIVGDFVLYSGLITQLWSSLIQATSSGLDVYDNKMKIDSIQSIKEFSNTTIQSGKRSISQIKKIEFSDVYFKYPGSSKYILKGVNFTVLENEKIALVGVNGSGKTTIIKLLLRFYDTTKGLILINDKNILEYELDELRNCFGTYFQNSLNFGFSIKDNITIKESLREFKDIDIINILKLIGGNNILKKINNNINIYLTRMFDEDGIEISGGEHQKIALARTFFDQNSAIILDEPSSALDPESEENIFKLIQSNYNEKMVFFTSHRLTNIFLADKILVLQDGIIIENGSRDELLKNGEKFAELYEYQASKFK